MLYKPDFITPEEERGLLAFFEGLEFETVVMHGLEARRRTVHYGVLYAYESRTARPGPPIPSRLVPLRDRAAALAGVDASAFAETLVSRYAPGAGIGWHRDAPMFGPVVAGISFGAPCEMRFRRGVSGPTELKAPLEPRSAYVLSGEARSLWRHSISPMKALRYSVTFRALAR
jgi:alkylated DNA repair protein (DNA oxidative demethylase)